MPEQQFRPIRGVLLDSSIPIARIGSDAAASLNTALEKRKGTESTWSHPQVAVVKDKVDLKGWDKTRLAIPLPGESWGTASYRRGELHAHEAGPFLLVHKDESSPGSGLLAHLIKDVPEALRKRFSGHVAPFVQEKPVIKKTASGEEFAGALPHIMGLAMGFGTGRQVAGETAAALAPEGRVGRSENIAKQLAIAGAPAGSILGSAITPHLVKPVARALRGTPTGRSVGQALEIGAPLIGGIGGGMLGGMAVGGLTAGIQHLRGPVRGKEKDAAASEDALAAMREEYLKIAFTTSEYAGPMGSAPFQQASQLPAFKAPGLKAAIEKPNQKIAEDSGLATYGKHIALNAGQALRDTKGIFSHPIADHIAPEGGPKRLLSSVALSVPNIANDLYYGAVPPQLTHTKDELKPLEAESAKTWFRRGAGLADKTAGMMRSGPLPGVFKKEKGVIGRAGQLLSGERSLALKAYKERYENHAERLGRKAKALGDVSGDYASATKRDAEITGRAAKRMGKIHQAEQAKSTAARVGAAGAVGAAGFAAGKAHESKEAALTPAGRLVSTQRKGTGMGATVTGPSIAEVAKPPRIGHAMPGALKNQI